MSRSVWFVINNGKWLERRVERPVEIFRDVYVMLDGTRMVGQLRYLTTPSHGREPRRVVGRPPSSRATAPGGTKQSGPRPVSNRRGDSHLGYGVRGALDGVGDGGALVSVAGVGPSGGVPCRRT